MGPWSRTHPGSRRKAAWTTWWSCPLNDTLLTSQVQRQTGMGLMRDHVQGMCDPCQRCLPVSYPSCHGGMASHISVLSDQCMFTSVCPWGHEFTEALPTCGDLNFLPSLPICTCIFFKFILELLSMLFICADIGWWHFLENCINHPFYVSFFTPIWYVDDHSFY